MIIIGDSKIKDRIENKKLKEVIKKINIKLKEIFKENPDFTGGIHMNFFMGGLTSMDKNESLKIK